MEVLLYFFARYLLAPIVVAVMIFAITSINNIKRKLSLKKLIVFILIATIILSLPCLLGFLRNEFVWGGLALTILSYLILGTVFYLLSTSRVFSIVGIDESRTAQIITMSIICVLGGWCYYLLFDLISGLPYSLWCATNIVWFVVPYLVMYGRMLFIDIPHPIYEPWELSFGDFDRNKWDNIDAFGFRAVKVKIKRKVNDNNYASLVVRIPLEISLGNWFNWMIEDQNRRFPQNKIETFYEGAQIGWIFYTAKWFNIPLFVKILDPKQTCKENNIGNNKKIYIRRVQLANKS